MTNLIYTRFISPEDRALVKPSFNNVINAIDQAVADSIPRIIAKNLTLLADGANSRVLQDGEKTSDGSIIVSGRYFDKDKRFEVSAVATIKPTVAKAVKQPTVAKAVKQPKSAK